MGKKVEKTTKKQTNKKTPFPQPKGNKWNID